MTDLTQNLAEFQYLSPEDQQTLRDWPHGLVWLHPQGGWKRTDYPMWYGHYVYRAIPALTPIPFGASQDTDPVSKPEWDYFQGLVNIARRSAAKAKIKYPQPNYISLKIAEEAGEVVRGAVHYAEGRMEWDELQGEIVQLLAMLIRFVTEGDEVIGIKPPDLVLRVPPAADPVSNTPTLDALAMQRAALQIIDPGHGDFHAGHYNAIAAIKIDRAAARAEARALPEVAALVEQAVAAERERCAKIAAAETGWYGLPHASNMQFGPGIGARIAEAIRAGVTQDDKSTIDQPS